MPVPRINRNGLSFRPTENARRRRYTNNTTSVKRQTIDSRGVVESREEMNTPGIGLFDETSQSFYPTLPDIYSVASDVEHSPSHSPRTEG